MANAEKRTEVMLINTCRYCKSLIKHYGDPNYKRKAMNRRLVLKYQYDVCASCASRKHHDEMMFQWRNNRG